MSPRTGRPPKGDDVRDQRLNIRISETESARIKKCADKLNASQMDTIMEGISLLEDKLKIK